MTTTSADGTTVKFGWIMAVLLGAAVAEYFELNMVTVALPTFYELFGSPAEVGWMLTSFALVGAASAAVGGRIGDVIGYRPVLILALASAAVGSCISATSNQLWQLILGRAIQGLSCVVLPLAIGTLVALVAQSRRQVGTAVIAGSSVAAGVLALWVSGHAIGSWGWRSIFWISGGLSLVIAALVLTLPRTRVRNGKLGDIDYVGGVLFAPGIGLLLAGITQIKPWGFFAPATAALLLGGLVVLVAWFLYERGRREPIVDVKLFRSPAFAFSCIAMALFAGGTLTSAAWVGALALDPTSTGAGFGMSLADFANLSLVIGLVIGPPVSVLAGRLTTRYGAVRTVAAGGVLAGVTFLVIGIGGILVLGTQHVWLLVVYGSMNTAAVAVLNASLAVIVVESLEQDETAAAVGVQQVIKLGVQSIGFQIVAVLLAIQLVPARAGGSAVFPGQESIVVVLAYVGVASVLIGPLGWLASRRAPHAPLRPRIAEKARAVHTDVARPQPARSFSRTP